MVPPRRTMSRKIFERKGGIVTINTIVFPFLKEKMKILKDSYPRITKT